MHREISEIRRVMLNSPWPKFLNFLEISGIRHWRGQKIEFKFPVCVVIGENGTGKSTVLKAAASAYENPKNRILSFYAGKFFPDTTWESFQNASIGYEYTQGTTRSSFQLSKPSTRFRIRGQKSRPKRDVFFFDISRTLPIDATVGYARIANRNAPETASEELQSEFKKHLSSILDRKYDRARFARNKMDSRRDVGILEFEGRKTSKFHQGAGEGASLDLMRKLQGVPEYSLVIIDEIENSLHPKAQRRIVHFLLEMARLKKWQIHGCPTKT